MPPLPPRTAAARVRDALVSSAARTVVLWVFLVVMFVVLWQVFRSDGPGAPEQPVGMWSSVLLQLSPVVFFGGVFGLLLWWNRRFAAANKRGVDLLTEGDLAGAAEAFRRLAGTALAPGGIARFNLGLALLRLGDLGGATEAFGQALRSRTKALRPAAAGLLALCAALSGDLDAADRWIGEARKRAASPMSATRFHLAAGAIVRLRRGDARGAAELLDETWGELERSIAADVVRALRVIRAFALEQAGGVGAPGAADLLAGARPFRPGEYAWIGAGWPEMERFLAGKGFAGAA